MLADLRLGEDGLTLPRLQVSVTETLAGYGMKKNKNIQTFFELTSLSKPKKKHLLSPPDACEPGIKTVNSAR